MDRLSARTNDSDGEDEGPGNKRARMPSAVCRELPTRAAVLRAQGDDEQARTRNRRIFGSLLGTLQKFKQEEIGLQTKVSSNTMYSQQRVVQFLDVNFLNFICRKKRKLKWNVR